MQNKSLLLKTTHLLSLAMSRGPWSLVTRALACLFSLCQGSRCSLKTLGMQLKDQQSRVNWLESWAALDLQDIWCLMTAQLLTSWVTLRDHWDISLWDADDLLNSQEQRASVGVITSPYSMPQPPPKSFLLCPTLFCRSSFQGLLASWIKESMFLHTSVPGTLFPPGGYL